MVERSETLVQRILRSAKLFGLIVVLVSWLPCLLTADTWSRTFGGPNWDSAWSILQRAGGGYVIAGTTPGSGGDSDAWTMQLSSSGAVQMQKVFGGDNEDIAWSVRETADGGTVIAGSTASFGAGSEDFWVLKLDSSGAMEWQKTYGGANYDSAFCIRQTVDDGFIVVGITESFGAGSSDIWVVKLDSSGNIGWEKVYGGSSNDEGYYVQQTADGGYVITGNTQSYGAGDFDLLLLKLDEAGNLEFQKTYGGNGADLGYWVQQTTDGGFIAAGPSTSFDVRYDGYVVKVDSLGAIQWQNHYGGLGYDEADAIQQTEDGGFILAGTTASYGSGGLDLWILKLDASGGAEWQKAYGGAEKEVVYSLDQTSDGGYVVAGYSGVQNTDLWVMKLEANGDACAAASTISASGGTASGSSTTSALVASQTTALMSDTTVVSYIPETTASAFCSPDVFLPSLSINNVSVTEGNSGSVNATFTATLNKASSSEVTVDYVTSNGSANGSDYNAASGTITIPVGELTAEVIVQVNGDLLYESKEDLFVNLSNAANA